MHDVNGIRRILPGFCLTLNCLYKSGKNLLCQPLQIVQAAVQF